MLEGGINTFKEFKKEKPGKVVQYFQSEDRAVNQLNPYLLSFFISYLLKKDEQVLLSISNCIPNLINIHLAMIIYFQDDKKLVSKLLKTILRLIDFSNQNLEHLVKSNDLKPIVQNKLLKTIMKEIDFKD